MPKIGNPKNPPYLDLDQGSMSETIVTYPETQIAGLHLLSIPGGILQDLPWRQLALTRRRGDDWDTALNFDENEYNDLFKKHCDKKRIDYDKVACLRHAVFELTEGHIGAVTSILDDIAHHTTAHHIGHEESWQDAMMRRLGSTSFLGAVVEARGFPK